MLRRAWRRRFWCLQDDYFDLGFDATCSLLWVGLLKDMMCEWRYWLIFIWEANWDIVQMCSILNSLYSLSLLIPVLGDCDHPVACACRGKNNFNSGPASSVATSLQQQIIAKASQPRRLPTSPLLPLERDYTLALTDAYYLVSRIVNQLGDHTEINLKRKQKNEWPETNHKEWSDLAGGTAGDGSLNHAKQWAQWVQATVNSLATLSL